MNILGLISQLIGIKTLRLTPCYFIFGVALWQPNPFSQWTPQMQSVLRNFSNDKVDLRTSLGDIWDVWMMAEDLPVKEIRCSLEVVAVLADHPPKIKLVTCVRVLKITKCICSIFNMHVPVSRPPSLYLSRVLEACLHVVVASNEVRTSRMTYP